MTYGILSYKDYGNNIQNLSQTMLGGRVFVKFINQAYTATTIDIPIPNVSSHTHLKFYTLQAGSYYVTTFTNAGVATVRLNPYSHLQQFAESTVILVFATQTVEPDYGILSTNNSGERLVSSIYPIPQFLQKITFNSTVQPGGNWTALRGTSYHDSSTPVSLGSGRTKIALFTIPENAADIWYVFDSYVGTGTPYISVSVEGPEGASYALPEAFIFALDNPIASSDTYGLRIYGPSPASQVLFDSGHTYVDITGFTDVVYDSTASTTTVPGTATTAYLVPGYFLEQAQAIPGQIASYVYSYQGAVKRIGSTLYTKRALITRYYEDAAFNWNYEYGTTFNTMFHINTTNLGGTGSSGSGGVGSGISAGIILTSGTSSCSYNAETASTCSTSQTFTASVSGGNGTAITYSWALVNATGFSISGSSTGSTVIVVNNSGGGTYTGTLQCAVSQSGSVDQVPTYSLSHTHTATVNPLTGIVNVSNQVSACAYTSGTTCTTSATYTVDQVSGGNGTAKTYSWALVNNTGGFTFTTGTTGTSVGITKMASAGTYTATLRCTVSQTGVSSLVIDTAVSHSHTAQTGSLVSPIPGATNYVATSTKISADPGGALAETYIWITSDGQVWIQTNGRTRAQTTDAVSWWWSTAIYPDTSGVPGIGSSYWVRFTRTAWTGVSAYSNDTTGWLQLNQDRVVGVYSAVGDNSSLTTTATYTIEVASTSTGGTPISTTTGLEVRAVAQNTYTGGPIS